MGWLDGYAVVAAEFRSFSPSSSSGLQDAEQGRSRRPLGEGKEHAVRFRIDGHGVAGVAGVLTVDGDEARLPDVEDLQVSALRRDVEPSEAGVDREHVGPGAARRNLERSRGKVDPDELRVALARDQRALAVGMDAQAVGADAPW